MFECNFYRPEDVRPLYDEIVPVYQSAFAGEPWYESSKCADADKVQRCVGGLSSLAIGQTCETCGNCPTRFAYERDELVARFENVAADRPTIWYTQRNADGLTLAVIAWQADAAVIASEKYADVPAMGDWLGGQLGSKPVVWLDEVFANRNLQVSGNLRHFGDMCSGLMERLQSDTLAFRTINKRMTAATQRDFPSTSKVYGREADVPDRREFVIIKQKIE